MKILHLNSYYNGSSFYKNLYDKQVEQGLKIDVFVPVPFSADLKNFDLGDYTLVSPDFSEWERCIFHLKHAKILKSLERRYQINNFTLSHAHSLFSNGYLALKLKEKYGLPYLVAVRNTDLNVFFKYMLHLRPLGVKILKEAEKIIFLSQPYRDKLLAGYIPAPLREEFLAKSLIIPNGIADFWLANREKKGKTPPEKKVKIIFAGRLNKNKNIIRTVKALEILTTKGYEIEFTVVGPVKDKKVYEQIKKQEFIRYLKPQLREELLKTYRENHIFVMPSLSETFGLVYGEALSQGLPVIYSQGEGFDGQFEDGVVGYAVDPRSPLEIARGIEKILQNYEILSAQALKNCDKFNWQDISGQYLKLYEEVNLKK
ncbi:MAG: glycosyltransferase family 4 protein [Desulfitobacteriia bacterium]|jgi:glycosyltransferase involved in cell wall biosynthesis